MNHTLCQLSYFAFHTQAQINPPGCSSTPIGEPPQAAPMGVLEHPGSSRKAWLYLWYLWPRLSIYAFYRMSWDGFEPSTYWFSINRIYRWAIRTFGRAALSFVALPQAVFDLPRAAFNLVPPLEGIPTNSRLLHRGYGPQLKLVIMLQYPLSRRQPRYAEVRGVDYH